MTELNHFFEDLARDAALQGKYQLDPQAVMASYGLSDEATEAVLMGNTQRLKQLSGEDDDGWSFLIIMNMSS